MSKDALLASETDHVAGQRHDMKTAQGKAPAVSIHVHTREARRRPSVSEEAVFRTGWADCWPHSISVGCW